MAKITDPYLRKVAPQHRVRPRFMAYLAAYLEKLEDVARVLRQMDAQFDLDQAVGKQLDVLGEIVGAKRLLDFEPVYAPALLTDEYYRMIVRAKISLNHWDGSNDGVQQSWSVVKNGYRLDVVDNQDMTMLLRVHGLASLFESEFISKGYLAPKPEGVLVNYEFQMEGELEKELFVGGRVSNTRIGFDLPGRREMRDRELNSELQVGGRICAAYITFVLPSKSRTERGWGNAGTGDDPVEQL